MSLTVEPTITVFGGTAVRVTVQFANATGVATDPAVVSARWRWAGGAKTTWTYTPASGPITKLAVGKYQWTHTSRDRTPASSLKLTGVATGTGNLCTVEEPYQVTLTSTPL